MTLTALDDELRAGTFAYVQQRRARFGDGIPAKELSAGVAFQGQRVPS